MEMLLRTDLSTLSFLAASEIFGLLELLRNAIASSIGAIIVEESRVEVVLFAGVGVCPVAACAPRLESFYGTAACEINQYPRRRLDSLQGDSQRSRHPRTLYHVMKV